MSEADPYRLIIGSKRYSSWSLRGWLAMKLANVPFSEVVVPMDTPDFEAAKSDPTMLPSAKVPTLWHGPVPVWDSFAILLYLADQNPAAPFWPKGRAAGAMARAVVAEMHSGFAALRRALPMNTGRIYAHFDVPADAQGDIDRIDQIWSTFRYQYQKDGDFLFGAFSAADIAFAPVASRFETYGVAISPTSEAYKNAVLKHPWMQEWYAGADDEPWRLEKYEFEDRPA